MEPVSSTVSYIPKEEIKSSFDKVPSDVVKLILSFLDIRSLKNSRQVCKVWSSFYSEALSLSVTIKKVTLKLNECLVDVSKGPYFDEIKKVYFKDQKSFCLQHESNCISFWTTNLNQGRIRKIQDPAGRELKQESYFQFVERVTGEWKFSLADGSEVCQTEKTRASIVLEDKVSNRVFSWPQDAHSVAALTGTDHDNDEESDILYVGTKKGELLGWEFNIENDFTSFHKVKPQSIQTFGEFYPETMIIGTEKIVIACNSLNPQVPSSCVQWRKLEDGSLEKKGLFYESRISFFNLIIDNKIVVVDKEIQITYENGFVLKHNLLEKITRCIKLPDRYMAPTLFSLSPYLVAYNIKSANTKALMLDEMSLDPLFEFDVGPLLNKGESLLGLQKYPKGSNEIWVITTSRILIGQLEFKSEETELKRKEDPFDRPSKRQKTLWSSDN